MWTIQCKYPGLRDKAAGKREIQMTIRTALALAAAMAVSTTAWAEGDAAKGEKVFKKKCVACHELGEGAKNKVGPVLTGIAGKAAAKTADFKYGKSLMAAGEAGLVWSDEELDNYLKNPKKYLRKKLDDKKAKSKMSFKLKKDGDRADVIAYLKSLSKPAE